MVIREAIVAVDPATVNVTEFCRDHGISTWFFWNLKRRFAAEGESALAVRSRARRRVDRTLAAVEDAIVAMRKQLVDDGWDAGPATIAERLAGLPGLPSEATIWRILKARGFIVPDPRKAPRTARRSFTAERANDCWQLDDTAWDLADGTAVKILNVVDDHSRLLVASKATTSCTGQFALETLAEAAIELGWPARFLSDNARAFRKVLATAVAVLGVGAGHSRPYHPQTNGKVERFHQTLKKWLAAQPAPNTLEQLQAQLDAFRHGYNHDRPHRSLGRRRPADVWAASPKSGPTGQPLKPDTAIFRGVVEGGTIAAARRYRITVGARYNGRPSLVVITGTNCHVFVEGELARALTLDPTRKHQPLPPSPNGPNRPRGMTRDMRER